MSPVVEAQQPRWQLAPHPWAAPDKRSHPAAVALISVLAVYVVALHLSMLAGMWFAYGYLGSFTIGDDRIVQEIEPDSAAFAAGLRVGDIVHVERNSIGERMALLNGRALPPNAQVTIHVSRSPAELALVATARSERISSQTALILKRLAGILVLALGAFLVILRPGPATVAFFTFSLTSLDYNISMASRLPESMFLAVWLFSKCLEATLAPSLLIFGWSFPDNRWKKVPPAVPALAAAMFLLGVAEKLFDPVRTTFLLDISSVPGIASLDHWLTYFGIGAASCGLVVTYTRQPLDRQKVLWMTAAIALAALSLYLSLLPSAQYPILTLQYFTLLRLAVPLAFGYTIMFHRVLDLRVAIAQTMIAATIGTLVTTIFILIETMFHFEPEESTIVTRALLALVIGLTIHWLGGSIERYLEEHFLFRARHRGIQQIARLGKRIGRYQSPEEIVRTIAAIPRGALALEFAAAYFRQRGGSLALVAPVPQHLAIPQRIARKDMLLTALEREQRVVTLPARDLDSEPQARALAVPLRVHGRVHGVVMFGFHPNGAALDEEEADSLRGLCEAGGIALDNVRAQRLIGRLRNRVIGLAAAKTV